MPAGIAHLSLSHEVCRLCKNSPDCVFVLAVAVFPWPLELCQKPQNIASFFFRHIATKVYRKSGIFKTSHLFWGKLSWKRSYSPTLANFPQVTKSPSLIFFFFRLKTEALPRMSPFVMSQKEWSGCTAASDQRRFGGNRSCLLADVLKLEPSVKFGLAAAKRLQSQRSSPGNIKHESESRRHSDFRIEFVQLFCT